MGNLKDLLVSNDESFVLSGIELLEHLDPNSISTQDISDLVEGISIENGMVRLSDAYNQIPLYRYRLLVALHLLNCTNSPLRTDLKQLDLRLGRFSLPKLEFVETLTLLVDDPSSFDESTYSDISYPQLKRLTWQSNGVLSRLPRLQCPQLEALTLNAKTKSFSLLSAYPHISELQITQLDVSELSEDERQQCKAELRQFFAQSTLVSLAAVGVTEEYFPSDALPSTLKSLSVDGDIQNLSFLQSLPHLEKLSLLQEVLINGSELMHLTSLRQLTVANASALPLHLDAPYHFQEPTHQSGHRVSLNITEAEEVQRYLTQLNVYIQPIVAGNIAFPKGQSAFSLSYNSILRDLKGFSSEDIQELSLDWVESLCSLEGLDMPNLRKLSLEGCPPLDLSPLQSAVNLEVLNLTSAQIQSLETLPDLPNLRHLILNNSTIQDLRGLQHTPNLEELSAVNAVLLTDISAVSDVQDLRCLNLTGCISLENVDAVASLHSLTVLNLKRCSSLPLLPDLSALTQIQTLKLRECLALRTIAALPPASLLHDLDLSWCVLLEELDALSVCVALKRLNLFQCRQIRHLQAIERLSNLTELKLGGMDNLKIHLQTHHFQSASQIQELFTQQQRISSALNHLAEYKDRLSSRELTDVDATLQELREMNSPLLIHRLLEGCGLDQTFTGWDDVQLYYSDYVLFTLFSMSEHPIFVETQVLVMYEATGLRSLKGLEKIKNLNAFLVANAPQLTDISALAKIPRFRLGFNHAWFRTQCFLQHLPNLKDFSPLFKVQFNEFLGENLPHLTDGTCFANMTGGYGLQKLQLNNCSVLQLGDLSQLNLQQLHLIKCRQLETMGLHNYQQEIEDFQMEDCFGLTNLLGLDVVAPSMEKLRLDGYNFIENLDRLPTSLEDVRITSSSLKDCARLAECPELKIVQLVTPALQTLEPLRHCTQLIATGLEVLNIGIPDDLFASFPNLKRIRLLLKKHPVDFNWFVGRELESLLVFQSTCLHPEALQQVSGLQNLGVQGLRDLKQIAHFTEMRDLRLNGYQGTQLDHLEHFSKLQTLRLVNCANLDNLDVLLKLPMLNLLTANGIPLLEESMDREIRLRGEALQSFLFRYRLLHNLLDAEYPNIEQLDLSGQDSITNLDFVRWLPDLTDLNLSHCRHLKDISGIAYHQKLANVNLDGCSALTDASALQTLTQFRCSHLRFSDIGIRSLQGLRNFFVHPTVETIPLDVQKWLAHHRINSDMRLNTTSELELLNCSDLESIEALTGSTLTSLKIRQCPNIEDPSLLNHLTDLKHLECHHLDYSYLPPKGPKTQTLFESQYVFDLRYNAAPQNCDFLHDLFARSYEGKSCFQLGFDTRGLEDLSILDQIPVFCLKLSTIDSSFDWTHLRHLSEERLPPNRYLSKQQSIQLDLSCFQEETLPLFPTCEGVEELTLGSKQPMGDGSHFVEPLRSLAGIGSFPHLKRLVLNHLPNLQDISDVSSLTQLQRLSFHHSLSATVFEERPMLGVLTQTSLHPAGIKISDIFPHSRLNGILREGDVITQIGEVTVDSKSNISEIFLANRTVSCTIVRDGAEQSIDLTPGSSVDNCRPNKSFSLMGQQTISTFVDLLVHPEKQQDLYIALLYDNDTTTLQQAFSVVRSAFDKSHADAEFIVRNMDTMVILDFVHKRDLSARRRKYNKHRISTGLKVEFIPLYTFPMLHYFRQTQTTQEVT